MSLSTLGLDVYQLTTLVAHAAAGRLDATLAMSFFFRKLPKGRNYVVAAGLRSLVEHAEGLRFTPGELAALHQHPVIGPSLAGASGQAALQALGQLLSRKLISMEEAFARTSDADELKNILATGGGGGMQLPGHTAQSGIPTRAPPGR